MPGRATVKIGDSEWSVGRATQPRELARGLGGLSGIRPSRGMLFDTGATQKIRVTTKPMRFSLDIAFFADDLKVTELRRNVEPGNIVVSENPARYFLEVNGGELAGIKTGYQAEVIDLSSNRSSGSRPNFKAWFLETRPQFLTLSVVLAFLGATIARYDGHFVFWQAVLAGVGLVFTHASVNILNDYFDYRSGVDLATPRTPFSGGSGILPAKMLTAPQVLWLGIVFLVLAVPIGVYFIIERGWELLPLLLIAAFFIVLYSPFILKRPWPEWAAGAGLGTLPILGMYFSQTGAYTFHAVIAAIPSGFLVHNLLLLNEFPDAEADTIANRKTLPISIGKKRAAGIYSAVNIAVYVWIVAWVAAGVMPVWALLGLLSLPFAIRGISGAFHNAEPPKLAAGMQANVLCVLLTQIFMGVGYLLAHAL
jgi:1,4-dihydroxy-2-naphthoate octaprenyltransferase